MATRPPLPVAGFAVATLVDPARIESREPAWREVFADEDAAGIWHLLSSLVRDELGEAGSDADKITQELFLELVTTNRPNFYLQAGFTENMIDDELRLLCSRRQ